MWSRSVNILMAVWSVPLSAQLPSSARPPIRHIGAIVARSHDTIATMSPLVVLNNGRVVLHDSTKGRLVMLDSALAPIATLADSAAEIDDPDAPHHGLLLGYRGDSTLYLDARTNSFLVISPAGHRVRVIPAPHGLGDGFPPEEEQGATTDGRGRLLYLQAFMGHGCAMPGYRILMRANISTSTADTAGLLRIDQGCSVVRRDRAGNPYQVGLYLPYPRVDAWSVLSDGTLAIIRAADYHIDWIAPDGQTHSTPPVAHTWRIVNSAEKSALLDSLRLILGARPVGTTTYGPTTAEMRSAPLALPDASELPDTLPSFSPIVKVDRAGRLWVLEYSQALVQLPGTATSLGPVYDVIDRRGVLVDRVQLPPGSAIAGFSAGSAYLILTSGSTHTLVRARLP